jgi:citrate lyase subunit beta/citryl-CoA lyase
VRATHTIDDRASAGDNQRKEGTNPPARARVFHPKDRTLVHLREEEVAWAKRVLGAANESKGAAMALDGKMIDRPVILKAEEILRNAKGAA